MTLRCLFVDFDSFFASVEQHDNPLLRDRPVAVIAVASETTCCLAASKEAKRFGVKTGTGVREAKEQCPDIHFVLARPARYIEMHHAFMAVIADCIPPDEAASIDEVPCWLIGRERERDNAVGIARAIKRKLIDAGISPAMTCSIGIAPNKFLAKTASDMNKPDGITVLEEDDLPHALFSLKLRDFCGIGPSMEARLVAAGIETVEQLCAAGRERLRQVWGGVEGERFWMQLRGLPVPERKTTRGSIGHSHVLGPELRTCEGMRAVLFKLLAKAAMRLRHEKFLAGGMAIRIRFVGSEKRFERDVPFAPLDDTPTLLALLGKQLDALDKARHSGRWNAKRHPPLSVAVTLTGLEETGAVTGELMPTRARAKAMSRLLDDINGKYGNNALYFGAMKKAIERNAAPMRIPFQHIPDIKLEQDARHDASAAAEVHDDLMQQRLNQAKVLAEDTHRKRQAARNPSAPASTTKRHQPSGAGGWSDARNTGRETRSNTADLF